MSEIWQRNIHHCRRIVEANQGPELVNVVSGSRADQAFWQDRLLKTRQDVFRQDGSTIVLSSVEPTRKGNFLGSLNAWKEMQAALDGQPKPPMMLMNMVFGLGKRLSPFTQALANRKPAFPTPLRSSSQDLYLTTADIASITTGLWLDHLQSNGFKGIIVKWGDEAVIPGKVWDDHASQLKDVDGVRFVWQTEPTEVLAREKEWVEFDAYTHHMTFQYTRQNLSTLRQRIAEHGRGRLVGVNLGSLGISYRLLQVAEEVFQADVMDECKWVDWDPYAWIALSCQDEGEWQAVAAFEDQAGSSGLSALERRIPDFFTKMQAVRLLYQQQYGRIPVIGVLDFGEPFWMDWGLHLSLRRSLQALTTDSDMGHTSRALFDLPHERDGKGNILVRSTFPQGADIRNSLLVDTVITDRDSVVHDGLVVAGRHRKLVMPHGGSALFCASDEMEFSGPNAIAFRSTGKRLRLAKGDRQAHLYLPAETIEMRANESLVDYEGENYTQPVMGNPISFEEASRRMSMEDTRLVEKRWFDQWSGWLEKSG